MGTRSAIAIPDDDSWRGRYVHWDGYPSYQVPRLLQLVKRDGYDKVKQTLIADHYGWSKIDLRGDLKLRELEKDGRFVVVPGYGVSYTLEDGVTPDDWVTPTENWDAAYVYVLRGEGFDVMEHVENESWKNLGFVPWGSTNDGSKFESS